MKPRICFLLNNIEDYDFEEVLLRYLPKTKFDITIADSFPVEPESYELIVPWSYRRIIAGAEKLGNIIIIHSSNLPEGRGWAPIYYTFFEQKTEYTISIISASDRVDSGNIIMRAHFPICDNYTASFIRKLDHEISFLLILKLFEQWPDGRFESIKQEGAGTYRSRRSNEDNEIDLNKSFSSLIPHLRGVEYSSPAYFKFNETKYLIKIEPEIPPKNPETVTIEFPSLDKVICWSGLR